MDEKIKKLIERSKDTTFLLGVGRRRSAVVELGKIGTAQVVLPLVEALKDEDAEVRQNALQALSSLKSPEAREVLRNLYLKTRKKALWQIIKKNNMFPEDLGEKFDYLIKLNKKDEIRSLVNESNFMEIVDMIINNENLEKPGEIILTILDKGGENIEMDIIKKFVETRSPALFQVIDKKNWYPPDLDKKLMFLLKTEQYQKVNEMLDGAEFREVLDILVNPKFPMKKQVGECLSEAVNPIIIDEICQVFLKEKNPHLGAMIIKNTWAPNQPRDKIFFYLKTDFLSSFFASNELDPETLGGYLEIPEIQLKMADDKYVSVGNFLSQVAASLVSGERPEIKEDNPLFELYREAKEYLKEPKSQEVIREICDEYLRTRSPLLEKLVAREGWAPEDLEERVVFYLLSGQDKALKKLNVEAIRPLYQLMKGKAKKKNLQEEAREALSSFKNPRAIDKIFRIYFEDLDEELGELIKENDWKPSDKIEKALYFIFSGQPERYTEVESEGHQVIFDAYKTLDANQRFKLLEILIKSKAENFVSFMLELFEYETNPRVLKLLCTILPVFFTKVYKPLREMLPRMEGTALREIIKTLAALKTAGSLEMLYYIARIKQGFISLWILKLLEDARYQPENAREKNFFYELYKIKDEIFRILQNRLVDEDPEIRASSAYTFSELGDEKILTTLMKYVDDPVDKVRAAMAYSIGFLCSLSPEGAMEQISNFRIGSIYMLFNDVRKAFMVQSDLEQIQILARNYEVGNLVLRIFSIAALEGLQKPGGVPTLLAALGDEDPLVKMSAIRSLEKLADKNAAATLYKYLEDDLDEFRIKVSETLGKVADEDIIKKVEKKLNSGEFTHSDSLLTVLAHYDAERFREKFERVISRPDYNIAGKAAAIKGIGLIGDAKAAKFLTGQLKTVRSMTPKNRDIIPYIEAMGIIGNASVYRPLEELLKTGDWEIRRHVIRAMSNIKERIALVSIIKALQDDVGWVQIEALKSLSKYMNHHFKFQNTPKDLKFIGAIISRLRKFKLAEIQDKNFPIDKMLANLQVKLMNNTLTRQYVKYKRMLETASQKS